MYMYCVVKFENSRNFDIERVKLSRYNKASVGGAVRDVISPFF